MPHSDDCCPCCNCFPGTSLVLTRNGPKPLRLLKTGEEVLCEIGNELVFSEVYMFGHHQPDQEFDCLQLATEFTTLTLSPGHYLPIISEDGEQTMKQAREVTEGDYVLVVNQMSSIRGKIEVITECKGQGLYAPFSMAGTLVVDNVLVSCYEESVPPGLAHSLLYPIRQMYKTMPKLLASINSRKTKNGIPLWAKFCKNHLVPLFIKYW